MQITLCVLNFVFGHLISDLLQLINIAVYTT